MVGTIALSVTRALWLPRINVLGFAPCFLAGVWAYARLHEGLARWPAWTWFAILPLWWSVGLVSPVTILQVGWIGALALAYAIAATQELPASVITRGAAQVAKYSYGIYLLHMPAWMIASKTDAPAAVRWPLYLVLLVGLPVAAYYLIEAPAVQWMRQRSSRAVGARVRPGTAHTASEFSEQASS